MAKEENRMKRISTFKMFCCPESSVSKQNRSQDNNIRLPRFLYVKISWISNQTGLWVEDGRNTLVGYVRPDTNPGQLTSCNRLVIPSYSALTRATIKIMKGRQRKIAM
uniref:Uncharacterized protein n=1 Tax=Megaselia scalaris TaxID=36166 RepID=T1GVI6_MEGSC